MWWRTPETRFELGALDWPGRRKLRGSPEVLNRLAELAFDFPVAQREANSTPRGPGFRNFGTSSLRLF